MNWFGFEVGTGNVHGLWQGPSQITADFGTVVQRMQLLGFNAVRLPFRFSDFSTPGERFQSNCNPVEVSRVINETTAPGKPLLNVVDDSSRSGFNFGIFYKIRNIV